jgi:hypothetical protein
MRMTASPLAQTEQSVSIQGTGVAASCCAHLLTRSGVPVELAPSGRRAVPALLLSDPALALLRDTFGRPDLFAGRPRIERRVVSWGGGDPVTLPHGAIVLTGEELETALAPLSGNVAPREGAGFTIHAAPPFPAGTVRRFGERQATAAQVGLLQAEDAGACWIEAVEEGWLFMLPSGASTGWLLAVGAPLEQLLAQSRHLAGRLAVSGPTSAAFETCARLLTSLQGSDWLACGTSAIAFDPICGDGTAQAVREGILACAVLAAMREGEDAGALLCHYESMLVASMRRHLRLCAQFYGSGGQGPWWQAQLAALTEGFDWCTARLATAPEPQFELRDFELVRRGAAA